MQVGDLVRAIKWPSMWGIYMGEITYSGRNGCEDYTCSRVYWLAIEKTQSWQTNTLEVINASR